MNTVPFNARAGTLSDPSTLCVRRRLPGPIDRVWSYLVDSELRRRWLASGVLPTAPGAHFEWVWRNDELSASPDERPAGFPQESRANCRLVEIEAPRRLRFEWPGVGEVCIELEPADDQVLLTLTHRRLDGEGLILDVSAGWHAHLAILIAHLESRPAPSMWSTWQALRADYAERLGVTAG
jgi:uncharacterized protein YndB with AHSA1/START domain